MKYVDGLITGMALTIAGCIAFTLLFPRSKEGMCEAVKKISKDMEKDLDNMM